MTMNVTDDYATIREIIEQVAQVSQIKRKIDIFDRSFCFIRPSGNPIYFDEWSKLMASDDIQVQEEKLMAIHKLDICPQMAYACFTQRARFTYKGTENDDVSVFSVVLKKTQGTTWKVVLMQRSTGRNPNDPLPKF